MRIHPVLDDPTRESSARQTPAELPEALIEQLRQRVAHRFYDQPRVVDAIARRLLHLGSS
jgi:hypothetical protein